MKILIEADVTRSTGKFVSRSDLIEAIEAELPSTLTLDEAEYDVAWQALDEGVEPIDHRQAVLFRRWARREQQSLARGVRRLVES